METLDNERDIAIKKLIKLREKKDDYINNCDFSKINDFKYIHLYTSKMRSVNGSIQRVIVNFVRSHNASLLLKMDCRKELYDISNEELNSSLTHNRLMNFLHTFKCPNPLSV